MNTSIVAQVFLSEIGNRGTLRAKIDVEMQKMKRKQPEKLFERGIRR